MVGSFMLSTLERGRGESGDTLSYLGPSGIPAPAGPPILDYCYNVPQGTWSQALTCSHLSLHTEGRGCDSRTTYSSHQAATQSMVVTSSDMTYEVTCQAALSHRAHHWCHTDHQWFPHQEMTSRCLHIVTPQLGQGRSTEL